MHLRNRTIVGEATVPPRPRAVTINSLPNEILYHIIQLVGSESDEAQGVYGHLPRESLLQAALVCRRWRHPAQEALFGWVLVVIRSPNGDTSPWSNLDLASRARVRSLLVKDLSANMDGVPAFSAALLDSPHIDNLVIASTMSYWPYLYHLKVLKRLHLVFMTEPILDFIPEHPPPPFPFQLETLCLDITHDFESEALVEIVPPHIVPILAEACSSLRSLDLTWNGKGHQPESTPDILQLLQPVLNASSLSLRHLRLRGGEPPVEFCTALGTSIKGCVHLEICIRKGSLVAVLEALTASGFCASVERLTIRPDYRAISRDAADLEGKLEFLQREESLPHALLGVLQSAPFARLRHVFLPLHYWEDTLTLDEDSRDVVQDLVARGVMVFAGEDLPLY